MLLLRSIFAILLVRKPILVFSMGGGIVIGTCENSTCDNNNNNNTLHYTSPRKKALRALSNTLYIY
jgi:hypothetical protein